MGGTNKQHKHKSKKKKHHHHRYRDSDSEPEKEYTKSKHHKKSSHKDKKVLPILVDAYGSTDSSNSDDDVIIVSPPPAPKISKYTNSNSNVPQVPPAPKISSSHHSAPVPPPPPPTMSRSHVSVEYSLSSSELSSEADEDEYDEEKSNNSAKKMIDGSSARSSNDVSLSVEETNRIRAKLGLKPLETTKISSEEKQQISSHGGIDMGDFVHKPPENIAEKQSSEKLKERLTLRRDRRIIEERLLKVKKLADESDSEDDDVRKWVEKNRRIVSEKEMAEKRAKELAEMDELFGIGELVEEDMKITKKQIYGAKDLKGLKVEHSLDNFSEGHDVILTLQDKPILGDDDDTLVNVNMLDEERYKKNIEIKRKKPGYNAYDDDEFDPDYLGPPEKKVLRKYDEEIEGEKKSSFVLGNVNNISLSEDARRELMRARMQQKTGRKLESLQLPILQPATDYYTEEEIAFKFKKPKKMRKMRKSKPLTADDLLSMENTADRRMQTTNGVDSKTDIKPSTLKTEPPSDLMDVDDVPAHVVSDIKIEEEEEDDSELQVALKRARKLKQIEMVHSKPTVEQVAVTVKIERSEEEESAMLGNTIVLNETAEFCRTLGDIPTYGHSGNRDDAQQILDFEADLKDKKKSDDKSGWNEVELDKTPVDIASYEKAILDEEPDLDIGVAGALKLAASKGYLEKEKQHRPSASKFSHLQAQNYSIEDKAFIEDDKHSRRERFNGPTQDFKEKDSYKPNIKLEYIDDDGHLLSSKEAFRYLSHKFHGKGPGKNKIEKRMKKSEQESLMKQMSSTDTPLGTLNMLQQKQKETQSPYVILSGAKQGQSTSISKLKF